ncbi:MAG TPA: DUF1127 domain-containing protein [Microvirga sp.]|jgi:uncharacterized protein YjiS (DUF1127 family)|nr:DUF1127 domain-containing protein [Microvirga sp.]
MSLSIAHHAIAETRAVRTPSALLAGIRFWFEQASRRAALRRARRELLDLPDFMLADMGLTRGEVAFAVEHGRRFLGSR